MKETYRVMIGESSFLVEADKIFLNHETGRIEMRLENKPTAFLPSHAAVILMVKNRLNPL